MKNITFPYMGTSHIVFKHLFEALGNRVVLPPRPSRKTLDLGVRYSPEFACFPYKILMGTYLETLQMGADTIISTGGVGPCRAGQYAPLHKKILEDLGYDDDEMIIFEPIKGKMMDLVNKIKLLNARSLSIPQIWKLIKESWLKMKALDNIEKTSHKIRAREINSGETTRVYQKTLEWFKKAHTIGEIRDVENKAVKALEAVEHDPDRDVLKVGIVGEIYVVLEPSANLEIEEVLGELGVEVERSIFLTGWTIDNAVVDTMGRVGGLSVKKAAEEYLPEMVGGHGQDSVGHTIIYAKSGFDGVVQLLPFTCIPEIVARSILPKVSKDYDIPILSVVLDEQTGKAGLSTRVEAFVDLLRRKREKQEAFGA